MPTILMISGVIMIVVGIVCGIVIGPKWFAIALLGVADFVFAGVFSRRAERP